MKNCSMCGKEHGSPFTDKGLLDIFKALVSSSDEDDREELLLNLAQTFACSAPRTDDTHTDQIHALLDEFEVRRLAFDQAALRLGRALLPLLAKEAEEDGPTKRSVALSTPRPTNVN